MDQIYLALSSFPLVMSLGSVMNYWPCLKLLNTGSCIKPHLVFTRLCCTVEVQNSAPVRSKTEHKRRASFSLRTEDKTDVVLNKIN